MDNVMAADMTNVLRHVAQALDRQNALLTAELEETKEHSIRLSANTYHELMSLAGTSQCGSVEELIIALMRDAGAELV